MTTDPTGAIPDQWSTGSGSFQRDQLPTVVHHGPGSVTMLGAAIRGAGRGDVVVLVSPSLASGPLLTRVTGTLGISGVRVLPLVAAHVPRERLRTIISELEGTRVAAFVTIGGGSATDTGKALRLAWSGPDQCCRADWLDAALDGHRRPPTDPGTLPLQIAIPTTLSGAEFTPAVGVTDDRGPLIKRVVRHAALAVDVAILDPDATEWTPDRLWASTGAKTFSDALEQLVSRNAHPLADATATAGAKLLHDHLPASLQPDHEARLACQIGSWLALHAMFGANVLAGLAAALRHQLGGRYNLDHGLVGAALLSAVVEINLGARPELVPRFAMILDSPQQDGSSIGQVVQGIQDFLERLGLPTTIADLDLTIDDLRAVSDGVLEDLTLAGNPVGVQDVNSLLAPFERG